MFKTNSLNTSSHQLLPKVDIMGGVREHIWVPFRVSFPRAQVLPFKVPSCSHLFSPVFTYFTCFACFTFLNDGMVMAIDPN